MSEFEELMKKGSQRREIKIKEVNRASNRKVILVLLGTTFTLSLIPPHAFIIIFIPVLILAIVYAYREWMG